MDEHERRIVRRKRPMIADLLGFSPEMQKKYRDHGLLTDDLLPGILTEQTEVGQCFRFLELAWGSARSKKSGKLFERLLDLLDVEGHSWLCDEMRADVLADRGELHIEEYIYREAGILVHKHFGTSKRISETEKKEIQYVIALRYQCAKEACQRQMEKIRTERDAAVRFKWEESGKIKSLIEKIATYLRVQRGRLNIHNHDPLAAIAALRDDPDLDGGQHLQLLEDNVDQMFEVTSRVLLANENMQDERKRCLDVLKITKPIMQLDIAVDEAVRHAETSMHRSKRDADMSDQLAHDLDSRMRTLKMETERQLAARERVVLMHESMTKQKEERIRHLESKLIELRQTQECAEEEAARWRKRCMLLEKTRRLGYFRPGLYENLTDDALDEELERLERAAKPVGGAGKPIKLEPVRNGKSPASLVPLTGRTPDGGPTKHGSHHQSRTGPGVADVTRSTTFKGAKDTSGPGVTRRSLKGKTGGSSVKSSANYS